MKKFFIGIIIVTLIFFALPLVLVVAGIVIAGLLAFNQYAKVVDESGRYDYLDNP
ncbi:hypothetical protein ACFLY1_00235 [Patescibacteria group bacterium]